MKLTKKYILKHFSKIIDMILYYDAMEEDLKAWDLIYAIEELPDEIEIEYIIKDFNNRNLDNHATFLYNGLLYGLVNDPECQLALIHYLKKYPSSLFVTYLASLNKKKGRIGDMNIEIVIQSLINTTEP